MPSSAEALFGLNLQITKHRCNAWNFSEAEEAPADLNSRIIFKAPTKKKTEEQSAKRSADFDKKAKKAKTKPLLSFADEEDDD